MKGVLSNGTKENILFFLLFFEEHEDERGKNHFLKQAEDTETFLCYMLGTCRA